MKRTLLLFFISPLLSFQHSYAQWAPQTAPSGTGNLYSVFAISSSAVGASGFERVIRTINGGTTWTSNLTISGVSFYELHTAEPTHWYSLALNSSWFVKMGNPTGITLQSGKPDSIFSLHFFTAPCGVAVGLNGKIESTCDTGITWQLRSSGVNSNLLGVWFADANTGCAVGGAGTIVRTTNAGSSWSTIISGTSQTLNGICFPTPTIGYVVGNTGTVLKSTNAGLTWSPLNCGVTNSLNGVFFVDADTGYVVGTGGMIRKTKDGGATWSFNSSGTTQILNSVHFISPTVGWIVGNNGTILKYTGISNGISENDINGGLSVYPNPAKDELHVAFQIQNSSVIDLEVLDITGRIAQVYKMGTFSKGDKDLSIDVSGLIQGIYFLRTLTSEGTFISRFTKE